MAKIASKLDDGETEFKYVSVGAYKYNGDSTNTEAVFWADNTGMIKTLDPVISKGTEHNERIGDDVMMRRVMAQYVLRWPLLAKTTNWNGRTGTTTDAAYSADFRYDLTGRIYLIRLNHADTGYASFAKYLSAFKRPYTLAEDMGNAAREMKKQEIKVLDSKPFKITRRVVNILTGSSNQIISNPLEGVLSAKINLRQAF